MVKLTGKAKAAFLKRINKGRIKAGLKTIKSKTQRKTSKSAAPKRTKSSKKARKQQRIKTTKKTRKTVAKKGKTRRKIESGFGKITKNKFVRGAVLGLGGAALVVQVTNRFAPQFSSLASPIGAFVFGGPVGLVASVLLQGGLGSIFGFGGQQGVDSGMKQSV